MHVLTHLGVGDGVGGRVGDGVGLYRHTPHSIGALARFRTRYLSVGIPVGKGVGSAVGLHKYSLRRDRGRELICSLGPLHNQRISFTKP